MRRQTAQHSIVLLAAAVSIPAWCCCVSGESDRPAAEAAKVAIGDAGHSCCNPRPHAGETSPASPAAPPSEPRQGGEDCGCGVDLYPGDEAGDAAAVVAPLGPEDVPSPQPVAKPGSTPPSTLLTRSARSPDLTATGTLRAQRVLFTI